MPAPRRKPLIILLNDNGMSIGQNVGGVASHLARIRTRRILSVQKMLSQHDAPSSGGRGRVSRRPPVLPFIQFSAAAQFDMLLHDVG